MNTRQDDQRNFYRICDTVNLDYIAVPLEALRGNKPEAFLSSSADFALLRDLQAIDQENSQFLRMISDHQRDVAVYLKAINRKIDLIAHAFIEQTEKRHSSEKHQVSLSEGGIAFHTEQEMATNTALALKITLLPSYVGLMLFGLVVESVFDHQQRKFRHSVHFVALKEEDRHILARHIIKVQSEAQRIRNRLND